jgi:hypothetical protein
VKRALLAFLAAACAHVAPAAAPSPAAGVTVSIAPQTVVSDPELAERGAELRAALAAALAAEGFHVADAGGLVVTTSIDYTPWTAVSAASLYVVVKLQSDGVSVDEAEVQRIDEAFPEPAKVPDLAGSLAHSLATSPRLRHYLTR